MEEVIYENIEAARAACRDYNNAIYELQTRFGVWEENEDSCSPTYAYARYYDRQGNVANYCHG